MSESKHTPGPWRVFDEDPEASWPGIEADGGSFSVVVYGLHAADDMGVQGRTKDESLANARLIAASPDLLEALVAVLARMNHHDAPWWIDCPNKGGFDRDAIEAAIAKVKGEGVDHG